MLTIKQLSYLVAVVDNQFNISSTADKLFISQPGISKQIKLLEQTLDCPLFVRNGKAFQGLTPKGTIIVDQARIILAEHDNLLNLAKRDDNIPQNRLTVASTSTQLTYVLPDVLATFHRNHPNIKLNVADGSLDQLIDIAENRSADCIILSGINERLQRKWFPNLLLIPCFEWYQQLICPKDHPLAKKTELAAKDLAAYPIITYPSAKRQISAIESLILDEQLDADIFATANDPKMIKQYVTAGMGIGIIAPMAYDKETDDELIAISLKGLLPKCTTIIAVERYKLLKPFVYDFIKLYAPHLTVNDIEHAINESEDIEPSETQLPNHVGNWCI